MMGNNKPAGGTKFAPPAPVILCLVHRILWKRISNLVNKLALLLHKCWLREDSWDKPKNDWCRGQWLSAYSQSGRSMIEMLGVLAIIGVLSVGGIAGYSKAMEKFKLTKAVGEYNLLVQGLVEHLSDFKKLNSRGDVYGIADTIQALGLVPDNWTIDQNAAAYHNTSFLDAYGNHSSLFSRWNRVVFSIGIGGANYDADGAATTPAFSAKFCEEIMANVFAPLHSFIIFTGVWRSGKGNNDSANYWYGDKYCKASNKQCLTNITPQQINEVCKKCTGATESCSVTVEME